MERDGCARMGGGASGRLGPVEWPPNRLAASGGRQSAGGAARGWFPQARAAAGARGPASGVSSQQWLAAES